jgi:tetratricopeptide (TPR) repeat protein
MSTLHILTLGPPQVRYQNELVNIRRRYPRGVLYYLAERGGSVDRQELLYLFENDPSDIAVARRNLRQALARLRHDIPDSSLIIADAQVVTLDWERVKADVLEFRRLLQLITPHLKQIRPNDALPPWLAQKMIQAIDLWRRPRFLPGAKLPNTPAWDNWITLTERELQEQRRTLLQRLASHFEILGEIEQAITYCEIALSDDIWNIDLYPLLRRLWVQFTQPGKALEHLERLQSAAQLNGVEEFPEEIVQLYHQIVASTPSLQSQRDLDWNLRPTLEAPFVGRQKAMACLLSTLPQGGSIFIRAQSGYGKSRLLKEFIARVSNDARVLLAHCHSNEFSLPFKPLVNLLRQDIEPEEWQTLNPVWRNQLALLLPELRPSDADPSSLSQIPPVFRRSQLIDAIQQLLIQIHRQRRLILCIEDIHWADEATLATVSYLSNHSPFTRGALMLVTVRPGFENPDLGELLNATRRQSTQQIVDLPPWSLEDLTELFISLYSIYPSTTLCQELLQRTGGNPYYLLEVLRSLLQKRAVAILTSLPSDFEYPENLQISERERYQQLQPLAREIIDLMAVAGTGCSISFLSTMLSQPLEKLMPVLDSLLRQEFLFKEDSEEEETIYFLYHDLLRQSVLNHLPFQQKTTLHLSIAQHIESHLGDNTFFQAAVLARHYETAGELRKAFGYWCQAGEYAHRMASLAEALEAFGHAEKILKSASAHISDEEILYLYTAWSNLLTDIDDAEKLRAIHSELFAMGQQRSSPLLTGTALDGLSDACMITSQFAEGLHYAERAVNYLKNYNLPGRYLINLAHRGILLYMFGDIVESAQIMELALEETKLLSGPMLHTIRGNIHYQLGLLYTLRGFPSRGKDLSLNALEDYKVIQNVYGEVLARAGLAVASFFLGEYHRARETCQEGIKLAEKINCWRYLSYLYAYQALITMTLGDLDAAQDYAYRAICLGDMQSHYIITAMGYRTLGDIYLHLNTPRLALKYYQRSLDRARQSFIMPYSLLNLGLALANTGEKQVGAHHIQQALSLSEQNGFGVVSIQARLALAQLAIEEQQWERVQDLTKRVLEETDSLDLPAERLQAHRLLAQTAWHTGETDLARQLAHDVASQAQTISNYWIELNALRLCHQISQSRGRPTQLTRLRLIPMVDSLQANPRASTLLKDIGASALLPKIVTTYKNTIRSELRLPSALH